MDVQWLQRDFGLYIVNLFDTGQASRVLGTAIPTEFEAKPKCLLNSSNPIDFPSYSLAFLLKHYCGVIAEKKYQLADWRLRYDAVGLATNPSAGRILTLLL